MAGAGVRVAEMAVDVVAVAGVTVAGVAMRCTAMRCMAKRCMTLSGTTGRMAVASVIVSMTAEAAYRHCNESNATNGKARQVYVHRLYVHPQTEPPRCCDRMLRVLVLGSA